MFQDPSTTTKIQDIEDKYDESGSMLPKIMGTLALGGFGLTISPIVGGALATIPLFLIGSGLNQTRKNKRFLRRHPGSYAHLISNEKDMVTWVGVHGKEAVGKQLLLAYQSGERLTPVAKRSLKMLVPEEKIPAKTLGGYLAQMEHLPAGAISEILLPSPSNATIEVGATTVLPSSASTGGVAVSPSHAVGAVPGSDSLPKNPEQLIAQLQKDCPVMLKLIKSHPIRAVGLQRSGKTTIVKIVALLRCYLLENHEVVASTPHYEPANPYPDVFKVVGWDAKNNRRDYESIKGAWNAMKADVERSQYANRTYIWDEFGVQDQAIPITPENDPIKSVVKSCLRETMKFGVYPIFIVHGETAEFLPGSKGLVTVFRDSTVRLEAIGEPVTGADGLPTIRPTGKFTFTGLDGAKEEGQLPAWLSEKFLLELIQSKGGSLPPEMEAMARMMVTANQVMVEQAQAPKTPTKDEIKFVGKGLHDMLKEKSERQNLDSLLIGVLHLQKELASQGRLKEAISAMLPHTCPTKEAFDANFPEHGNVYLWVMGE